MQLETQAQKVINDFRAFLESKDLEIKRKSANYPKKVRFDVDYYYKLMEAGLLPEDNSTEIIDGELIEKMPIGSQHAAIVKRLNRLLGDFFRANAVVSIQDPVRLNRRSEPQPDVALLRPRADFYSRSHPTPADVLLLIEVSDSTIDYDREIKIPLYAAAQIAEVWIVDLNQSRIEVYTEPETDFYQSVRLLERGETLSAATLPDLVLAVAEILGDEQAS